MKSQETTQESCFTLDDLKDYGVFLDVPLECVPIVLSMQEFANSLKTRFLPSDDEINR